MRAVKCSSSPWPSLADLRWPRLRQPRHVPWGLPQTYQVGAPSVFVTTSAWVFIVLAVVFSVLTVLRSAEAASLLPALQIASDKAVSLRSAQALRMPQPALLGLGLLLSLSTLVAAIGTLRRIDGARRSLIGLLGLVIGIHLLGLLLQHALLPALLEHALAWAVGPVQAFELFGGLSGAARWIGGLLTLAGCGLLGLVIRGLMAPAVRQEFA